MNNPTGNQQELIQLLSHYFSQRGSFLAQVIRADLQSLIFDKSPPLQTNNGNAHKEKYLHEFNNVSGNSNTQNDHKGILTKNNTSFFNINSNSEKAIIKEQPLVTQASLDVTQILIHLVAKQTGYPTHSISINSRLLDDLNLDSIKAGELIAAAAKECGVAGSLDPSTLANATLEEVAQVLQSLQTSSIESTPVPIVETVIPGKDLTQMLLEMVEERTGFPKNTLNLNLRLLDDLNLDSIKAADLIATAAKKIGISGTLDPSTLANATLADVITALQQKQPATQLSVHPSLNPTKDRHAASWVRNFAVQYIPHPVEVIGSVDWSKAQVLLICDEVEDSLAQVMSQQFSQLRAMVQICTYSELTNLQTAQHFTDYITILPQISLEDGFLPLSKMVSRLHSVTSFANASANLTYIQFGGGYFGSGTSVEHPEVCCAAGFARSVHLERPQSKIKVIDLAREIKPEQAAQLIISELESTENILSVGYNAQQIRLIPQYHLQQPVNYLPRNLTWSEEDVILVTGGAKGITAECAIALAQQTEAKMALVGRSPVSSEITQILNRFQAQGLTCRYYPCDIAHPELVQDLVQKISQDLGKITGVIHGAGLNQPRRVEQVSFEAALTEVSPKLLGAYNLLEALSIEPPKLFLAFSSIIGVTGMPGNSWYAFANESLSLLIRHYQAKYPQTQVLSIAYSVWDEIGMGAKLGSVKHLERMGIGAISPAEGVSRFLKLVECDPGVSQVVITARLGGLDTWSPTPLPKVTGLRFIEEVLDIEPNVELKARAHLTLERDLYLGDHLWRGSYLFPTVFGLEAMAQSAAYLTGIKQPPIVRITDISLRRPIVVAPTTGVTIEIQATLMEVDSSGEQQVKVSIRTEQTGFSSTHFSATLILGKLKPGENVTTKLEKALTIEPKTDLYGDLLFQGKRFQRIETIFSLDEKRSVFRTYENLSVAELHTESFASALEGSLLLGDPYFRDVLLQSVQLTIPQDICLPVEISNIEFFAPSTTSEGIRTVTVSLIEREGREYLSEVIATDPQGNLLERLTGYRLRILEEHPEHPTARELANPDVRDHHLLNQVLQKAFAEFGLPLPAIALGYAPNLRLLSKKQRRSQEQAIVARALKTKLGTEDIDFQLTSLTSGKPTLVGTKTAGLDLSLSHCDRYCLCVIEENPQGCDIEAITSRSVEDWIALLGCQRSALLEELVKQGDTYEQAGTRIWSSVEAIRKAFNNCDPEFSIIKISGRVVILKTLTTAGEYWVVSVPVKLTRPPERMIAVVLPHEERSLTTEKLEKHTSRYTHDGPQGQLVYEQRFQVSFKESGSISRHIYFSQYFRWIGQIRELPMESIASEILGDFLSGDWGMVTNAVSLRVLGEATGYDIIQARAWVGNVIGSSFDTYIEFCKVLPNHSLERLAIAEVKATWVRLISYGVPAPMPFPDYLQSYLNRFAAQIPASLDLKRPETLPLPPLPTSLSPLSLGTLLEQTPALENRYGRLLRFEVFQTTLEESNLVGNVYYGNYFIWQGRILDLFLYSVAPDYLRVSNPQGEIVCLYSRMDYLREAMPFDRIGTRLYIQSVFERGAVFCFEFFRELADGSSEKLHVGQQEVAWVIRDEAARAIAAPWPTEVLRSLLCLVAV